jgi:hypothetical protein
LAFAAHRWELAATQAAAAIAAAPEDPRGHELLGLALKEQGKSAESIAAFNVAVEKGTRDFQPLFEVAVAAQNAGVGYNGSAAMDAAEARRIANLYERAINLHPRFLPAYQNLAGVMGLAEPWGEQDHRFFEFGQKLFPADPMIRIGVAVLKNRSGDKERAQQLLQEVLAMPDLTNSAKTYARRLENSWESEDVLGEVQRLAQEKKFAEAVAVIDLHLGRNLAAPLRAQLRSQKRQLSGLAQTAALETAFSEQRWTEARKLANDVMASDAPMLAKAQARRRLAELDRRKLGHSLLDVPAAAPAQAP